MANLGNTSQGASSDTNDQRARAVEITMPEAGTITHITAWVNEENSPGDHTFEVALYDTSGNLLSDSAPRNDISTTNSEETFALSTPYAAAESEVLLIAVGYTEGGNNVVLRFNAGGPNTSKFLTLATGASVVWPNPVTWGGTTTNAYSIYATYTPAGGGSAPRPKRSMLMGVG